MKKNGDDVDAEILKAVAQAWHGHSISSKAAAASEFDAHRLYFKGKPSRFKAEAMSRASQRDQRGTSWDFRQSLWDSYEIVSVSKKLEMGLVMDRPFTALNEEQRSAAARRRESKNSLRSLFNRVSSRRFTEADEFPTEVNC